MHSTNDVAYVSATAHGPTGHCDADQQPHTDGCACGSTILDLGNTGCKIKFTNDLCGGGTWTLSEPKRSGIITVTATVANVNCAYIDDEGICHCPQVTYTATGKLEVDIGSIGCTTCSTADRSLGTGAVSTDGDNNANFRLNLGPATTNLDAGYIALIASNSWNTAAQPVQLAVPFAERPAVEVIPVTNSTVLKQVMVPQGLVNVTVISDHQYQPDVFSTNNVTGKDTNGYYGTNGQALVTWVVENPGGAGDTNHLTVIEQRDGVQRPYQYTYTPTSARWDLLQPDGQTLVSSYTALDTSDGSGNTTNFFYQVTSAGQTLKETVKAYQFVPGLNYTLLKREAEGTGATARTNTYVYYSSDLTNGASTNLLQRVDYWDGKWAYYTYDALGRVSTNYSTYGTNAPPAPGTQPNPSLCKVTQYAYSLDNAEDGIDDDGGIFPFTTRRTIVKVPAAGAPQEISRTYHHFYSQTWDETQECPNPGALWGDAANLRTVTITYDDARPQATLHPDGTATVYSYGSDGYTTTTQTGQPNSSSCPSSIVDGTQTTTVVDDLGLVQSITNQDIVTGVILSAQAYNYKDGQGNYLDPLRRSYDVTDLAGRTTQYRYGDCCGMDHVSDPDGVTTYYEYDSLMKWQFGSRQVTTAGGVPLIELTNRLDGLGRVLARLRAGTNGTVITQAQVQYDLLGQVVAETNALNGATAHTNFVSSLGQRIWTNTYPDGGTRVEMYNRDGQLAEVLGTAAQPVRYTYDVEADGSVYRSYAKEIKLNADGSDSSEWTKTYTDGAGHAYKTVYAPRPGVDNPNNPPYQYSLFNEYGQVWQETDPDGVTTLYSYDGHGRQEYIIKATNTNGLPATYDDLVAALGTLESGSNRITQVQRSVVAADGSGPDRVRADTLMWDDGQQTGTLVSRSETSAAGLDSWQTVYRDVNTPVVTHNQTTYGTGGGRSETTTAPDASYTISGYSCGRLASVARYDSQGNPLSSLNYGYDPHGRQNTVTDARNGTTTCGFNNADLVTSVTTPNPGTLGGTPQTTTTVYDTMSRAITVVNPDGTGVTNGYALTGLLTNSLGSRTYPVAYAFDAQGRLKTMTTWTNYPSGNTAVTTWNYDSCRGWLTNKSYADGTGPIYGYSPAGRLASRLWARGTNTVYSYNNAGDLAAITYSDATPGVTNTYDRRGRQATIAQNGMTTTRTYDDANNLLSETDSGSLLTGLSVTNGYDHYLRRTNLSLLYQSSTLQTINYGYDNASRLKTVTDNTAATPYSATYNYLANSPLVSNLVFMQSSTTRMTTTKSYDYLNRLLSVSSAPSAAVALTYSYAYNNANQRTLTLLADNSYWLYDYDSLGQVISGHKYFADLTPVAGQRFDYTFDTIGNRRQTLAGGDQNGANQRSAAYTANNLNQYTQRTVPGYADILGVSFATNTVTVGGQTAYRKGEYFRDQLPVNNSAAAVWTNIVVSATGQNSVTGNVFVARTPESFTYDADGNLTQDGRWTYTWDAENRLVSLVPSTAVGPQSSIKFEYDSQGRRIAKQVWPNTTGSGNPTNDVLFLYDGWNLVAELNSTNSAVIRSFLWGLDLSGSPQGAGGVGGLLKVTYTGAQTTNCFVALDGNGNVAALADAASTNLLAQYEYGPFGELLRATGPMAKANPFRFSTKYEDAETDLLYYGRRYLNTSTGRWLGGDPIEQSGGLNLYGFVGNNAVCSADSIGLLTFRFHVVVGTGGIWSAPPFEGSGSYDVGDDFATSTVTLNNDPPPWWWPWSVASYCNTVSSGGISTPDAHAGEIDVYAKDCRGGTFQIRGLYTATMSGLGPKGGYGTAWLYSASGQTLSQMSAIPQSPVANAIAAISEDVTLAPGAEQLVAKYVTYLNIPPGAHTEAYVTAGITMFH